MEKEEQKLIDDQNELVSERNFLINDMDEVIRKIDNGEIVHYNNELVNIANRINNLYDKEHIKTIIIPKLNKRKLAVECKLGENPKLKNLISMNRLYEKIDRYNNLMDDDKYDSQMGKFNGELWNMFTMTKKEIL